MKNPFWAIVMFNWTVDEMLDLRFQARFMDYTAR